jgi:phosphodiesterase/alkaline phosphatase D-like protein
VFRHGVASGDPLGDRVVLWPRVSSALPISVDWVVARDAHLLDVAASGAVVATPVADGTVHVDVTGLDAGTTYYYYGFRTNTETSPIGRTRTLQETADHCRSAIVSCAKFNAGYFNALLHECLTLADYRTRDRQYHGDADVQRFHAAHPSDRHARRPRVRRRCVAQRRDRASSRVRAVGAPARGRVPRPGGVAPRSSRRPARSGERVCRQVSIGTLPISS